MNYEKHSKRDSKLCLYQVAVIMIAPSEHGTRTCSESAGYVAEM